MTAIAVLHMEQGILKNPLAFWSKVTNEYPLLSLLACKIFVRQVSSSQSERDCSSIGLTITDLRSRLNPDTIDKLETCRRFRKNHSEFSQI
jgi:hypothetical protein